MEPCYSAIILLSLVFRYMSSILLNKCTRYVCRCDCEQAIYNNSYSLLSLITCHNSCYSFKFSFNYTNHLAPLKFWYLVSRHNDVIRISITNDTKTFDLIVWDNKGLLFDFVVEMEVAIVKTKEWKVYVVVNKRFYGAGGILRG